MKGLGQVGFALIQTVIFITLIGFLGVVAAHLSTSGTVMTTDHIHSQRALYIAEGGMEYGLRCIKTNLEDDGDKDWRVPGNLPPECSTSIFLGTGSGTVVLTSRNHRDRCHVAVIGRSGPATRTVTAVIEKQFPFPGNPVIRVSSWQEKNS